MQGTKIGHSGPSGIDSSFGSSSVGQPSSEPFPITDNSSGSMLTVPSSGNSNQVSSLSMQFIVILSFLWTALVRLLSQAFLCTLLKKLNHEKNSKNRVQEKNSAKFCPKTQPTAGFSLLKNYKKTPFMKKLVFLLLKLNFSPSKLNAPQAFGLNCPAEKCTKKSLYYVHSPMFPLLLSSFVLELWS